MREYCYDTTLSESVCFEGMTKGVIRSSFSFIVTDFGVFFILYMHIEMFSVSLRKIN
jgi:hypothetical protein